MGPLIQYTLRLPAMLTPTEVVHRLESLRLIAASLPIGPVTRVVRLTEPIIRRIAEGEIHSIWRWAVLQHERPVPVHQPAGMFQRLAVRGERIDRWLRSLPDELIGFTIDPGDGAAIMDLWVSDNPGIVTSTPEQPPLLLPGETRWHGSGSYRPADTGFVGGLVGVLRRHLGLIAVLDAAQAHGISVEVSDSTGYHRHRQLRALVETVGTWNALLAEIGEALRRRFGSAVVPALTRQDLGGSEQDAAALGLAEQVCDLIERTRGSFEETTDGR